MLSVTSGAPAPSTRLSRAYACPKKQSKESRFAWDSRGLGLSVSYWLDDCSSGSSGRLKGSRMLVMAKNKPPSSRIVTSGHASFAACEST